MKNLKVIFYKGGLIAGQPEDKLEAVTDNFDKWLINHNKGRKADGQREETEDEFRVEDVSVEILGETMKTVKYGNMILQDHNKDGSWWSCIDCEVEFSLSREELIERGVEMPPL